MQTKIKFPSKRFMLMIFLCSSAVILLQNYNLSDSTSFLFNLLSMFFGFLITLLFFVPSIIIKRRTDLDFMSLAHMKTPSAIIFTAAFYCIYFVYTAEYFLLVYTDMFSKKLNSEANIYAVALILLAVCVYAAYKGTNAIARSSIIIFAFSFVAFALIFSGNISNVRLENSVISFDGGYTSFIDNTSFFITPAFTSVIFGVLSGYTKNFKSRHLVFTLGFAVLLFALVLFFYAFSLGKYAYAQDYQSFLLSKTAHIGEVGGFDSFYLSLSALAVFVIISLILTCMCKSTGRSGSLPTVIVFSVIIYVLFICANHFNSIKEILTSHYLFNILTFISAVVIPTLYIFGIRRKQNG